MYYWNIDDLDEPGSFDVKMGSVVNNLCWLEEKNGFLVSSFKGGEGAVKGFKVNFD